MSPQWPAFDICTPKTIIKAEINSWALYPDCYHLHTIVTTTYFSGITSVSQFCWKKMTPNLPSK